MELAQLLAEITPGKLEKTYRATGGSEAVDIALQVAMASTGRRKFVAVEGSYHGNTIGAVSIAATEGREPYPHRLSNCLTIAPPLGRRAAERLERLLAKRDVAAFIMEPISCNLAVMVPEDDFASAPSSFAGATARCSSPTKWHVDSAARGKCSPPSISIFSLTSSAWERRSPAVRRLAEAKQRNAHAPRR